MSGKGGMYNPFHNLNQFSNQFFNESFPNRCYDGVLPWTLCDCFLKYQETIDVITAFVRLRFTFDEDSSHLVFREKTKATMNLEKCMKDCLSLLDEYNRKREEFLDHHNLEKAKYKAEKKLWLAHYRDLNRGRVFDLESTLILWISEQEATISPEIQAACDQRQFELGSRKFKVGSLLQYVTWRTGLRRKGLDFTRKTRDWIDKFIELYEYQRNLESRERKKNERLEYLCHDLLSIAKAFKEPILLALLPRYLEYNEILKREEETLNNQIQGVSLKSISVFKVDDQILLDNFEFIETTKLLLFSPTKNTRVQLHLSLPCELSISGYQARSNLYIASKAATYRFVYPLDPTSLKEISEQILGMGNGLTALLSSGGYLYFDEDGKIVSLTGIQATTEEKATLISRGPFPAAMNPAIAKSFEFHNCSPNLIETDSVLVADVKICWIPPKILSLDDNGTFLMEVHRNVVLRKNQRQVKVTYEFCRLSLVGVRDYSQTRVLHKETEFLHLLRQFQSRLPA